MRKLMKMKNNSLLIKKFREFLSEQGKELTLKEAEEIYYSAKKIIEKSKNLSQIDLWKMQNINVDGMTEQEKNEAISLYQHVRDIN